MLTVNVANTSGEDIKAGSGFLPSIFDWADIDDGDNKDFNIEAFDLQRVESNHSGFMVGELLQKLVQDEKISVSFTALTSRSVSDDAVSTADPS